MNKNINLLFCKLHIESERVECGWLNIKCFIFTMSLCGCRAHEILCLFEKLLKKNEKLNQIAALQN